MLGIVSNMHDLHVSPNHAVGDYDLRAILGSVTTLSGEDEGVEGKGGRRS